MARSPLMASFPAPAEAQVTVANWMKKPFNEWAFRNVRQVLPTATIRRSDQPVRLPVELGTLEEVRFEGLDGRPTTLRDAIGPLDIDGLLVLHKGKSVFELYEHGLAPHLQHIIFSVSKSFTGTLIGILADKGKLDPDEPVTKYLPEAKESAYASARIQHLLDMNVGITFTEDYLNPDGDVARYRRAAGWGPNDKPGFPSPGLREFLMSLKPSGEAHGETFHYVSPNTDSLGWIIERVTGLSFAEAMHEYIWQHLGAEEDGYIGLDPHSFGRAAGGICVTLRDLAKFGEMMRNNGVAANKQIVPRWWIEDIRRGGNAEAWQRGGYTDLFPKGNYRNKWYTQEIGRSAFCGIGIHGQYLYIDPDAEMVIARQSSQPVPFDVPYDQMFLRACRAIGDTLSKR